MNKEIVSKYAKLVHQIHRLRNRNHANSNIKDTLILWFLSKNENCTPHDIVNEFSLTPQMVSGIINHLEGLDYIYRKVDKEDRRKFNLVLTEKGKQQSEILIKDYFSELDSMLEFIGKDDVLELIRIYEKIKGYYKEEKQ